MFSSGLFFPYAHTMITLPALVAPWPIKSTNGKQIWIETLVKEDMIFLMLLLCRFISRSSFIITWFTDLFKYILYSYKAKPHYHISLWFCEATSSWGPHQFPWATSPQPSPLCLPSTTEVFTLFMWYDCARLPLPYPTQLRLILCKEVSLPIFNPIFLFHNYIWTLHLHLPFHHSNEWGRLYIYQQFSFPPSKRTLLISSQNTWTITNQTTDSSLVQTYKVLLYFLSMYCYLIYYLWFRFLIHLYILS